MPLDPTVTRTRSETARLVVTERKAGATVEAIAERYAVSRASVYRILKDERVSGIYSLVGDPSETDPADPVFQGLAELPKAPTNDIERHLRKDGTLKRGGLSAFMLAMRNDRAMLAGLRNVLRDPEHRSYGLALALVQKYDPDVRGLAIRDWGALTDDELDEIAAGRVPRTLKLA